MALRGRSSTKCTRFGTLKLASFPFKAEMMEASLGRPVPEGTTTPRHGLAKIGMRHADDRRFAHAFEFVDGQLDLLGVDVVAAGDDQILRATDDGEVTV